VLTDGVFLKNGSNVAFGFDTLTTAVDGLLCIFSKLTSEQKQMIIEEVSKIYTDVLRNRSLSKFALDSDRSGSAKLAYSVTRIMMLGVDCESLEKTFGSSVILPLVGTVQWRYDTKTILEDEESLYWEACTTHALQILASWLEQGKSLHYNSKTLNLHENIWMVARPGKAPRKALDFGTAVELASKSDQSCSRLHAERIQIWLNERL